MTRHLSSCADLEDFNFALCIMEADKSREARMMILYLAVNGDELAKQFVQKVGWEEELSEL